MSTVDIDTTGIPALFDTVAQWRAESMQVVNWGGFQGHRQVELSGTATLISGASGTGKSTLMDAYLAVMMPSDVPFNGASNDATTGRARSADQRNLLTYLRGKVDTRRDPETGALKDVTLRGDEQTTWGAVAVTFRNDDERRFTVLRAYIVPRRARGVADIQMTMATVDDVFDLRRLEDFVPSRFAHLELTGRIPGLVIRDTYQELAYTLQTRLGIGDSGGGNRAMRLLARIQAGQHMPTVDALYKSLVLETPRHLRGGGPRARPLRRPRRGVRGDGHRGTQGPHPLPPSARCTTRSNGPGRQRRRSTASPPARTSRPSRTGRRPASGSCSTSRSSGTPASGPPPAPRSRPPRPGTPRSRSSSATRRPDCATLAATRWRSSRTASTAAPGSAPPSPAPARSSTSAPRPSANRCPPRPSSPRPSAPATSSSAPTPLGGTTSTAAATP
ncbi:ATP-binding protein [Curtobacterium sp. MCPF17_052]|uniref:ATP-binding protein n=1 Tax=Curtobacterium sp. MCPF17_052 TaxID=2175655 RepID=UPI0024DF48C7|nr:ATP-binding protein [Curtobacterium sp. MCPF17_052]WIB12638.1 ATP-binding protein [Curtobacterium sp. MCPF17_052]